MCSGSTSHLICQPAPLLSHLCPVEWALHKGHSGRRELGTEIKNQLAIPNPHPPTPGKRDTPSLSPPSELPQGWSSWDQQQNKLQQVQRGRLVPSLWLWNWIMKDTGWACHTCMDGCLVSALLLQSPGSPSQHSGMWLL